MSEPTFTSLFVIAKMLFEVANLSFDEYFKRRWSEKDHNSFLILPLGLAKYRYFACSDRMWQEAANNSCCCTNVRKLLSDLGPGYLVHTPQSEFWSSVIQRRDHAFFRIFFLSVLPYSYLYPDFGFENVVSAYILLVAWLKFSMSTLF